MLAVPWFKCIRRTSCHHIHSSYFNFLRAEYVDWMLTVIIGGLVFTAAMSSVLGGSCHCDSCSRWVITGVIMLDGRFCQSQCDVQVSAFVAFSVLSHGPDLDSSSINKVTKFLVKGFYWNRFPVSSQISFRAFLQTKTFTSRLRTIIGLRTVCYFFQGT